MSDAIGIGIDLGVNGAVAVIAGDAVTVQPLPLLDDRTLDAYALHELLYVAAMPHFGVGVPLRILYESVFRPNSLVQMMGEAAATCKLLEVDHLEVPVVRWKKAVLGSNTSDKQVVIDWCRKTYPAVSLRRTPRARTDSHDYADAVALARYAKGLLSGDYKR